MEHEQTAAAESGTRPAQPRHRLVIRAVILPDEPAQQVVETWSIPRLLAAAVVLAALAWLGWIAFKSFTTPSAPVPIEPPIPQPQVAVIAPTEPAPPDVSDDIDGTTRPVDEVIPKPSNNALQTIRGTIRISLRLGVDRQGRVVDVKTVNAGPSRYFERLCVEAAKRWTFTPASTDESRSLLLRFQFTRDGVTARVDTP